VCEREREREREVATDTSPDHANPEHHHELYSRQVSCSSFASLSFGYGFSQQVQILNEISGTRVAASDLVREASSLVASLIGKPESYVMVSLRPETTMCFGGTEDPTAYLEVVSLGSIGGEKNKSISAGLCGFLQKKIGVPPNRTYIQFVDPKRSDFGFNSSTFG